MRGVHKIKLEFVEIQIRQDTFFAHPIITGPEVDFLLEHTQYPSNFINNRERVLEYLETCFVWVVKAEKRGTYYHFEPELEAIFRNYGAAEFEGMKLKCIICPPNLITEINIKSRLIRNVSVGLAVKKNLKNNQLYGLFSIKAEKASPLSTKPEKLVEHSFDNSLNENTKLNTDERSSGDFFINAKQEKLL